MSASTHSETRRAVADVIAVLSVAWCLYHSVFCRAMGGGAKLQLTTEFSAGRGGSKLRIRGWPFYRGWRVLSHQGLGVVGLGKGAGCGSKGVGSQFTVQDRYEMDIARAPPYASISLY